MQSSQHTNTTPLRRNMSLLCTSWEKAFTHFLWSPLPSFSAAFLWGAGCVSSLQVDTGAHQPFCLISPVLVFGCVPCKHRATMLTTQIKGCSFQYCMCVYGGGKVVCKPAAQKAKIYWGKEGNENETMRWRQMAHERETAALQPTPITVSFGIWYCSTLGGSIGSPLVV